MGHDLSRRTSLKGGLFATAALAATPLQASSGSPADGLSVEAGAVTVKRSIR